MKILFITFSDIGVCSSSNIRNVSLIQGLLKEGNTVDIITYKSYNKAVLVDKSFAPITDHCKVIPIYGRVAAEKVSSGLLAKNHEGIKKKIYHWLRKVYYSLEPVDSLRKIALTVDIDRLDIGSYDLMISSSNPYSVHILARRIKDRYFPQGITWVQYWGDALYLDTLTRHPLFPFRVKKAERKLIELCDNIVYTNGVVLDLQKQLFPPLADKMTFIETPYAFADSRAADIEYEVGYFGGYSSLVRDIAPLYAVLRSAAYPSVIIGNGDVALQSEGALRVMPRASVDTVSEFERKTRILVCICNKASDRGQETGLIPGKAYHYGATGKAILVIGATPKVKEFLAGYGRYAFADNNEEAIRKAISDLLSTEQRQYRPLAETNPPAAARKLLTQVFPQGVNENG